MQNPTAATIKDRPGKAAKAAPTIDPSKLVFTGFCIAKGLEIDAEYPSSRAAQGVPPSRLTVKGDGTLVSHTQCPATAPCYHIAEESLREVVAEWWRREYRAQSDDQLKAEDSWHTQVRRLGLLGEGDRLQSGALADVLAERLIAQHGRVETPQPETAA
jgi:hypothetical protein